MRHIDDDPYLSSLDHGLPSSRPARHRQRIVKEYPGVVMCIYMRSSMLDLLLVQLRRLYDPDLRSLAAGTIALLLAKPNIREFLIERAFGTLGDKMLLDRESAEKHLQFVQGRCALAPVKHPEDLQGDAPPLQIQAFLTRHAANKRSAHMTLDYFSIGRSDIRDVCVSTVMIARAMQRVFGPEAYTGNYADVDWGSYEAAAGYFNHRHSAGLLTDELEMNLDSLIHGTRNAGSV